MSIPQVLSYWFLLRLQAVLNACGQGRSTFYDQLAKGLWPQAVSIGLRAVAWPAGEIASVIAARVAGQSDDDIRSLVKQLEAARKGAPQLIAEMRTVEPQADAACPMDGSTDVGLQNLIAGAKKARKPQA